MLGTHDLRGGSPLQVLQSVASGLLRDRPYVAGALFGVLVYLFMNFVIPLSAIPFRITYSPLVLAKGLVSHALLVGIPIALFIRYFSMNRPTQASQRAH
jgi:hypothetical protein